MHLSKTIMIPSYDNYTIHKKIWESFSQRITERNFLFSIDRNDNNTVIMVLSCIPPLNTENIKWQIKQVPDGFLDGKKYFLKLRANVCYRNCETGKRMAITIPTEIEFWFIKKANSSGFSISNFSFEKNGFETFEKGGRSGGHNSITFLSEIEVQNSEKFKQAFSNGIGPARGFGYGMMLLHKLEE